MKATSGPLSSWTCDEVSSFIGTMDVGGKGDVYKQKFLEEQIDGESLQALTINHYKSMGIPLGHATIIMKKISETQSQVETKNLAQVDSIPQVETKNLAQVDSIPVQAKADLVLQGETKCFSVPNSFLTSMSLKSASGSVNSIVTGPPAKVNSIVTGPPTKEDTSEPTLDWSRYLGKHAHEGSEKNERDITIVVIQTRKVVRSFSRKLAMAAVGTAASIGLGAVGGDLLEGNRIWAVCLSDCRT
jgi:hypothetical protein